MPATMLRTRAVEKTWGQWRLPPPFDRLPEGRQIGEVWFAADGDAADAPDALLIKFLFTSDKLSVQVHPDDDEAKARGLASGKEEAWLVLAADPGAAIGIGLRSDVEPERLRAAALDGSIEKMLDWRPAAVGDIYYVPPGTIHSLGAGLVVLEAQQNADVTYRLYDFGRPRGLHLDEALSVATPGPYRLPNERRRLSANREVLTVGRHMFMERWLGPVSGSVESGPEGIWLTCLKGGFEVASTRVEPGQVTVVTGTETLSLDDGAELIATYPGAECRMGCLRVWHP
jgi:mannose-6-phosphate isomerase